MPLISNKRQSTSILKHSRGFTLLEVMVAMVIFSIGLLGLASLQGQSVQFSHSAYLKSQGTFYAYDILDKMRVNRGLALSGNYNATFSSTGTDNGCYSNSGNCTAADMASHDVYDWKQLLASLPDGNGSVTTAGTANSFTVIVSWTDRSALTANGKETITVRSDI